MDVESFSLLLECGHISSSDALDTVIWLTEIAEDLGSALSFLSPKAVMAMNRYDGLAVWAIYHLFDVCRSYQDVRMRVLSISGYGSSISRGLHPRGYEF